MEKGLKLKFDKKMIMIILSLAWPTMLEELLHTAVQYIDTAMVGSLGTAATAAVGATTTVNWMVGSTISALGIGFLAGISKSLGADDEAQARRQSAAAVFVVLILGAALTVVMAALSPIIPTLMQVDESIRDMAAKYFFILYLPILPRSASIIFGTVLRAAGDTKTPMKIGLIVNLTNVVLNFLFIYSTGDIVLFGGAITNFGFGFGVYGAAIASAIAYTVGGIIMTVCLIRHKRVSPRGVRFIPKREIIVPIFKVALPNMLQRFVTSFGYVAFASMINSLGDISTAAHTVANTVESLFYIPGYGMQTAAATLAGNCLGANDKEGLRRLSRMFIPIEVGLMIISGAALFFSATPLVSLFSTSPEVIALGSAVLKMVALSEPFYGFSIIIEGFMLGVGKTKRPFIYNALGMWGVRNLGTLICTTVIAGTLIHAWACMILHNLMVFALYLISYIRGSWLPKFKEAEESEESTERGALNIKS